MKSLGKLLNINNPFEFAASSVGKEFLDLNQNQVSTLKRDMEAVNKGIESSIKEIREIEQKCREQARRAFSGLSKEQKTKLHGILGTESQLC